MAIDLNAQFRSFGTRFRVYPQAPVLLSVDEPEIIWLSRPAGHVGPGPADERLIVRDAIDKHDPYDDHYTPPFSGPMHPPALPDADGHFDHLPVTAREFRSAHMYAVIRRVLDVWECYFGHPVPWHFDDVFSQLELIPEVDWDNAQSGFGFIETGARRNRGGHLQPYCLNFDVLAHEIGHSLIYSSVGWPTPATETPEYFGFQESAADMTALLSSLHFDSVVDRLLASTAGNLYVLNELNRVAELSENEEIRIASNDRKMSHYAAGWIKEHHLSQPMTGALFDVLVGVFQELLIERELIDRSLADAAYHSVLPEHDAESLQSEFNRYYHRQHEGFRDALLDARDYLGRLLANAYVRATAHHFRYVDFAHSLLDLDLEHTGGRFHDLLFDCFRWREIGQVAPGPRLSEKPVDGARSCR